MLRLLQPLKRYFSDIFNEGIKKLSQGNMSSQYRRLAIASFLTAWQCSCTYKNCQAGAQATGTYPCNKSIPLSSRFVQELDPRYAEKASAHQRYVERNVNISAKIITDDDNLQELSTFLMQNNAPDYCLLQERIPYEESMKNIAEINENNSKLLSSFPKYVDADNVVRKTTI